MKLDHFERYSLNEIYLELIDANLYLLAGCIETRAESKLGGSVLKNSLVSVTEKLANQMRLHDEESDNNDEKFEN